MNSTDIMCPRRIYRSWFLYSCISHCYRVHFIVLHMFTKYGTNKGQIVSCGRHSNQNNPRTYYAYGLEIILYCINRNLEYPTQGKNDWYMMVTIGHRLCREKTILISVASSKANLKYHGKICHECLMGDLRQSDNNWQ